MSWRKTKFDVFDILDDFTSFWFFWAFLTYLEAFARFLKVFWMVEDVFGRSGLYEGTGTSGLGLGKYMRTWLSSYVTAGSLGYNKIRRAWGEERARQRKTAATAHSTCILQTLQTVPSPQLNATFEHLAFLEAFERFLKVFWMVEDVFGRSGLYEGTGTSGSRYLETPLVVAFQNSVAIFG